jgi:competence protein ComFC
MRYFLQDILGQIVDLTFPMVCSFCGGRLSENDKIKNVCRKCMVSLEFRSCKQRLLRCVDDRMLLDSFHTLRSNIYVYSACYYSGNIRNAVLKMKFGQACYFAESFASILKTVFYSELNKSNDIILPIPIHKDRFAQRGYDQAVVIAEKLSDYTGVPYSIDHLKRIKKTKRQSESIDLRDRFSNLSEAFVCKGPDGLKGKRIILLDDVLTTGATIFNAVQAVKKSCGNDADIVGMVIASNR